VIDFFVGLTIGFFTGSVSMWKHLKDKMKVEKHIYHIDPKDAVDLIESDEEVKKLKKELNL